MVVDLRLLPRAPTRAGEITAPPSANDAGRDLRVRGVLRAVPHGSGPGFTSVLVQLIEDVWHEHIVAEARATAPAVLESAFVQKLRAGFSVYCALGLSAIVCARHRPWTMRAFCAVVRFLGLSPRSITRLGEALMPWLYRALFRKEMEAIAVASFLILALDEVLDDVLGELPPRQRASTLALLVRTGQGPDHPLVILCARMLERLRVLGEPKQVERTLTRVVEWAADEVLLELPGGSGAPRQSTIEVSMELLALGAPGIIRDRELRWMQSIAELGQMVDDIVDLDKDRAAGRTTLAVSGIWTTASVSEPHNAVVHETLALVQGAGERHPATLLLYEQTLRAQLRSMAETLITHP